MSGPDSKAVVSLGPWDQAKMRAVRRVDPGALLGRPAAIAALSDLEACHAVKRLGVEDAAPLLAHLNPDQTRALFDLEAWTPHGLAPSDMLSWLAGFREAGLEPLGEAIRALDPEAVAVLFSRRLHIAFKPTDDTPPEEIPEWLRRGDDELEVATTPDDRFMVAPRAEDPDDASEVDEDDRQAILQLLADLYRAEDWELAPSLLRLAMTDDRFDMEENARRFRTGRLEDLGFPPSERVEEIYHVFEDEPWPRASARPPTKSDLPLVAAYVPESEEGLFFDALRRIRDPTIVERIESEVVPLANAILVADRAPWSSLDAIRIAVEKGIGFVQAALGADDDVEAAAETLAREPLRTLFRRGWSRTARLARRLRRLGASGAFRLGADPWGLLEAPDHDAVEALTGPSPRFPEVLEPWRDPEARERPLDVAGLETRRAVRSAADLEAAEGLAQHLEGWAAADGALALSTGLQRLDAHVLPPEPEERTLRLGLTTALAQAWLGGEFAVRPLAPNELAELARRLTPEGELAGQGALLDALVARLEGSAAASVRREASWGLGRAASALAPFAASGRPDPRFIEGLLVREQTP